MAKDSQNCGNCVYFAHVRVLHPDHRNQGADQPGLASRNQVRRIPPQSGSRSRPGAADHKGRLRLIRETFPQEPNWFANHETRKAFADRVRDFITNSEYMGNDK
jgi:hypothetical protein